MTVKHFLVCLDVLRYGDLESGINSFDVQPFKIKPILANNLKKSNNFGCHVVGKSEVGEFEVENFSLKLESSERSWKKSIEI